MAKRKVKHYDGTDDSFVDPDAESYMHDTEQRNVTDETPQNVIEKTSVATPSAKKVIVTKEQLASSGFDNLRDYLNAQRRGTSSGPSTYQEMLRNAPSDTSELAIKALKSNAENEAARFANLEKGVTRGRKSTSPLAPRATQSAPKKPYSPSPLSSSYPGSRFSKGGKTSASKRADGCATKGHTKGRML